MVACCGGQALGLCLPWEKRWGAEIPAKKPLFSKKTQERGREKALGGSWDGSYLVLGHTAPKPQELLEEKCSDEDLGLPDLLETRTSVRSYHLCCPFC